MAEPPPPAPRPTLWPWLLAVLLSAAGGIAVVWALTQGAGPDTAQVPTVVGLPATQAESRVRAAGFLAQVQRRPSPTANGVVLSQAPEPGATLSRGSYVGLTASTGPALVAVPSVRGLARNEAEARLRAAGLIPVVREVSSSEPAGTVVAQEPAPQVEARKGSRAQLSVAR